MSATPPQPAAPDASASGQPSGEEGPHLFVVSDSAGFVGAFPSAAKAAEAVAPYSCIPFIVHRFVWAPGARDRVWIVVGRHSDAVLHASNSRADADRVKRVYATVGLADDDDIDYWEQPAGAVSPPALRRLSAQQQAYEVSLGPADKAAQVDAENEAKSQAYLDAAAMRRDDGPLARALREMERVTIMDCVVPAPLAGGGPEAPSSDGAVAGAAAGATPAES